MSNFIDMTGWDMWEHGVPDSRLTVICRAESTRSPCGHVVAKWLCECNCKDRNQIIVSSSNIRLGKTKSCGCLAKEQSRQLLLGNNYGRKNKKYNTYDLSGEYGIGYTSKGEEFYFDLEDYDLIKEYCWNIHDGYVNTIDYTNGKTYIKMHRLIMNAHPEIVIDHKIHQTIDNRKENLRRATPATNHFNHEIYSNNTSGVSGVNWDKESQKWRARLWANGVMHHLGRFDNFDDAVAARIEAEEKYFGEFSYDNSMKEYYNELQQSS